MEISSEDKNRLLTSFPSKYDATKLAALLQERTSDIGTFLGIDATNLVSNFTHIDAMSQTEAHNPEIHQGISFEEERIRCTGQAPNWIINTQQVLHSLDEAVTIIRNMGDVEKHTAHPGGFQRGFSGVFASTILEHLTLDWDGLDLLPSVVWQTQEEGCPNAGTLANIGKAISQSRQDILLKRPVSNPSRGIVQNLINKE